MDQQPIQETSSAESETLPPLLRPPRLVRSLNIREWAMAYEHLIVHPGMESVNVRTHFHPETGKMQDRFVLVRRKVEGGVDRFYQLHYCAETLISEIEYIPAQEIFDRAIEESLRNLNWL